MILQSLTAYYERMRSRPASQIAPPGFAPQPVSFALVLDQDGRLLQVQDIRDASGRRPRPISLLLPQIETRTSKVAANFLWDNTGYVLALDNKGRPERTRETFEAFKELQHRIGDSLDDPGVQAVLRFLERWDQEGVVWPEDGPPQDEVIGSNVVFRLYDQRHFVHERSEVRQAWESYLSSSADTEEGICLVTGESGNIARTHGPIKGVYDPGGQAQKMIVSFNLDAFCSYDKRQNLNAPVGASAAFAYTTALNHLLRRDSRQKIQIGDATTVFWTERESVVEDFLGFVLDPREDDSVDESDTARIRNFLGATRAGKRPDEIDEPEMRFYILGLAPNAARLAVRYWYVDSVDSVSRNIGRHFADLSIERDREGQAEFPGVWQLLIETAPLRKRENINPTLAGPLMRAILQGIPYPSALLSAVVTRIRADQQINYYRAAIIKAVLTRNYQRQEVTMALDEDSRDVAYVLGRLFATLERAQQQAIPSANATIKDRFFGSASATPNIVFPQLIRLSQHHLSKLEEGSKIHHERLIQDIMDRLDPRRAFPAHLTMEQQGMFALGYYHQRKFFFTKKESQN